MTCAKTLPRRSMHLSNGHVGELNNAAGISLPVDKEQFEALAVPLQHAPRPMTLPTRGAAQRVRRAELAHLSKTATTNENGECDMTTTTTYPEHTASTVPAAACESPSYMTHQTTYNFPATPSEAETPTTPNEIPLPPREGKKQVKTNAKRHIRKYPLIIPPNGMQRTLSKVIDAAQDDNEESAIGVNGVKQLNGGNQMGTQRIEIVATMRTNAIIRQQQQQQQQRQLESCAAYENMPATSLKQPLTVAHSLGDAHTYQNLDKLSAADAAGLPDTASMQFESILEADNNKDNVLQSPDVTDGFYNFSIQKEHYNKSKQVEFDANKMSGLYVNEDELRNLDNVKLSTSVASVASEAATTTTTTTPTTTEATANLCETTTAAGADLTSSSNLQAVAEQSFDNSTASQESQESQAAPKYACADNELAANALFKKVRESVNSAMMQKPTTTNVATTAAAAATSKIKTVATPPTPIQTEAEYFAAKAANLASSNSVSCEDLLEFADKKPKGCERGVDSDEVRIMTKVLGKDIAPTRCLSALEFINWDVHKAIKLIKLQNILADAALSLKESFEALQAHEWDLHMTALKRKGIRPR